MNESEALERQRSHNTILSSHYSSGEFSSKSQIDDLQETNSQHCQPQEMIDVKSGVESCSIESSLEKEVKEVKET